MAPGEDAEVAAYTSSTLQLIKSPLAERKDVDEATLNNSRKPSLAVDADVDDGLEFAKVQSVSHFL